MTGAKLIGIYANHNASHALMQHTELGLSEENGAFRLNNKVLTSLHDVTNQEGEYISKNNSEFLASSVDAVKDPVLSFINQSEFTADASMLLSRSGYSAIEIAMLMSQPIVKDISTYYFRNRKEGKDRLTAVSDVLEQYKKRGDLSEGMTYENHKDNKFLIEDLAKNILISKEMDGITNRSQTNDYDKVQYWNN